MKPEWRRFAPIGLYLSLAALVAMAVLLLLQHEWNLWVQISLGVFVLGLALFALLDPDRVRRAATGRQARHGSNAIILAIAFVGIVVVVNYFAYENSKRWDLTADKQFTLAPETLETLKILPEPILARAFFTARTNKDNAQSLLEQYKYHAKDQFNFEFIDPEADPIAAEKAKITRDGTVVLVMGDRQEPVTMVSEQELTGGLVRLLSKEQRTIYFLTGHGEHSPEDTGDKAYSLAKRTLESKNYAVKTLNLVNEKQIPQDAKVIVVAGPRKPVSAEEVDLLSLYAANGGSLVVMEDSVPVTDFGDAPDPLAAYLTESWGVTLGIDYVIDQSSDQPAVAVGSEWGSHQITNKLQAYVVVMPSSRSVSVQAAPQGVSQTTLVSTSVRAWAETDLAALSSGNAQVTPDEGVDLLGPVSLAAIGENFEKNGRVVVFGDSDFASDGFFLAYGNQDFFTNSIDWAAGQEELINLTPKNTTQRVMLPPQQLTMNLIVLGTVCLMPGLILLAGIVVWAQRRRKG